MTSTPKLHPAATCHQCREHYLANFTALIGACASVGIEHKMSTERALRIYFTTYHEEGHRL